MDAFVSHSVPQPRPIATSGEIVDRDSVFVGTLFQASSPAQVQAAVNYVKNVLHSKHSASRGPASHEMLAWRYMSLKSGRTGLGGPDDFEVCSGSADDGERWGGSRVLQAMEAESILDAVVIVSRWYGGTMLGPVRFTHIENCAREVCRTHKAIEQVQSDIERLTELDGQLEEARNTLASLNTVDGMDAGNVISSSTTKKPDYKAMLEPPDPAKSQRLVKARQRAVDSVKSLITLKLNELGLS